MLMQNKLPLNKEECQELKKKFQEEQKEEEVNHLVNWYCFLFCLKTKSIIHYFSKALMSFYFIQS